MRAMHLSGRTLLLRAALLAAIVPAAWGTFGTALAADPPAAAEPLATSNPSDPIKALIKLCEPPGVPPQSGEQIQNCHTLHLYEIMQAQGPAIGMLALYQTAEASPAFANLCHVAAHHLSEVMYGMLGNVSEAMALCREGCTYGCQHAVLKTHLRGLPPDTVPDFERLCPHDPQRLYSYQQWNCTHGVGHGLAHYFADVSQALSACNRFSLSLERRRCAQGVFMEHALEIVRTQAPPSAPGHHLALCAAVEAQQRRDCYLHFITLVYWATGGSVPAMFIECQKVASADQAGCYWGIGRGLAALYIEREDELPTVCRTGSAAFTDECILGFASVLVNVKGLDRGFGFCGKLAEEVRIRCVERMGQWTRLLRENKEEAATECRKAGAPRYVQACLSAKFDGEEPSTFAP